MVQKNKLNGSGYQLIVLIILSIQYAFAGEIVVASASNFVPVLRELTQQFESEHPNDKIVVVSASSGKLYAQIIHGAPFDVFLSADQEKPLKLEHAGYVLLGSRFTYALGSLVLWSADSALIENSPDTLFSSSIHKLALANPKLAPYGVAAQQVLQKLGLDIKTKRKWVQGENIAQTHQFVLSGNAEIGFVAKSQVWKHNRLISGSAWMIPDSYYSPIKQDAVILKAADNVALAEKFMAFLQRSSVRNNIESFGYASFDKPEANKNGAFQ